MSVKVLKSWKIATTSQPFFPTIIECIGFEAEYAVSIYTAHTVNTFIFRHFIDAIENDKSPQKCYLHASLEPEAIQAVTVGANESSILMTNGQLKFFQTPKKLVTVEYLSSVKAICSTRDGFALIKSSSNGTNFFVEIHPDKFQATQLEPSEAKTYDISFASSQCQSSWHRSQFKIKELHFPAPASHRFLARIFRDEIPLNEHSDDRFLFFSIDNNLFSLQMDAAEHFVIPIVTCAATIVDFWAASDGKWIGLLLNSNAMMLMCLDKDGCELHHELVYFGTEITSFALSNDLFIYSNEASVEWMGIELNEEQVKFEFCRNVINLPGIVALTILTEFSIVIAISENCQFYAITLKLSSSKECASKFGETKKWLEVDSNIQRQLNRLKFDLYELTEAYDNLVGLQSIYQHMIDAIKLKRADDANKMTTTMTKTSTTRFVASCLATKQPPTLSACDESQAINVVSTLAYDRNSSFFVQISLVTVIYANEFNTNIWNLRCRWLNDMRENEYANVKLTTESLLQPIKFIVHLRQQHLPEFHMDVNTIVKIGESVVYLSFPVHMTQPNYCELLQVMPAPARLTSLVRTPHHTSELVYAMKLPQGMALNELFPRRTENGTSSKTNRMANSAYEICLLGKRLTLTQRADDAQIIELRCNDASLIYFTKLYVHDIIRRKLTRNNQQIIRVTANALKEYNVSSFVGLLTVVADPATFCQIFKWFLVPIYLAIFSVFPIFLCISFTCLCPYVILSFQNFDNNFVNVVDSDLSQNNNGNGARAHAADDMLLPCIGKIRLVPPIEFV